MVTTGYSGTPLPRKLGIKEGMTVALVSAPDRFEEALVPGAEYLREGRRKADLAIVFATQAADLVGRFHATAKRLPSDGTLWVAWPKRASRVPTDITEDRLRELFLPTGWVDVKVIAIDATWSGLKFVLRKDLR